MKNLLLLFFAIFLLNACISESLESPVIDDNSIFAEPSTNELCLYSKSKYSRDSIFPFNLADKIEIIAYDSNFFQAGRIHGLKKIKQSLSKNRYGITQRIILNSGQKDTLFSIFHDYKAGNNSAIAVAACYEPHHAILFYNNNRLIEYLELCFACSRRYKIDSRSDFGPECGEKWCYLSEYFKKCGIKRDFTDMCTENMFSK